MDRQFVPVTPRARRLLEAGIETPTPDFDRLCGALSGAAQLPRTPRAHRTSGTGATYFPARELGLSPTWSPTRAASTRTSPVRAVLEASPETPRSARSTWKSRQQRRWHVRHSVHVGNGNGASAGGPGALAGHPRSIGVAVGVDHYVTTWSPQEGAWQQTAQVAAGPVTCLAYMPRGLLVIGHERGAVMMVDPELNITLAVHTLESGTPTSVAGLALLNDAVLVGDNRGGLHMLVPKFRYGRARFVSTTLDSARGPAVKIVATNGTGHAVVLKADGTLSVWQPAAPLVELNPKKTDLAGSAADVPNGEPDGVTLDYTLDSAAAGADTQAAFCPWAPTLLAIGGAARAGVRIIDVATRETLYRIGVPAAAPVSGLAWLGKWDLFIGFGKAMDATGAAMNTPEGSELCVGCVHRIPDGEMLASIMYQGYTLMVEPLVNGVCVASSTSRLYFIEWKPDLSQIPLPVAELRVGPQARLLSPRVR